MNITISQELAQVLENKVASGKYQSMSEVVEAAVQLLEEQEAAEINFEPFREEIEKGIASLDAGRSSVFDREQLRREAQKRFGKSW
ncbi:MAG: type II toxin-antitoxin system ParD family antitoxin [Candidatus Hydrogenedentes bacterium]|nr:type II toxin-antitoxin system ParD family antitoxin [Candidatus Hydrogenedentota bacterium]